MILSTEPCDAIIYTDGGYLLATKEAGWGVHGYTYLREEPKRGTGNSKVVPTDVGYKYEESDGNKVTVVNYIDMAGGEVNCGCNNEAELIAFVNALKFISTHEHITNVQMFSDSRYVVIGTLQHLEKWEKRGWLTTQGEPVKYRKRWEEVKALVAALNDKQVDFKLAHIKAHNGHPGNTRADLMAGRGLVLANKKMVKSEDGYTSIREGQGYWNLKVDIPRILQSPRWYFSTSDDDYIRPDGSVVYCVGTHGTGEKEDEFTGKPYADNFLGVVRMRTPEPIMEVLRTFAMDRDKQRHGAVILGMLDNIFGTKTYSELTEFGTKFLRGNKKRIELQDSSGLELISEVRPLGKAFRMVDVWQVLTKSLDDICAGSDRYTKTDITDLLYEVPDAKKGVRKIKPSINQAVKHLDVEVGADLSRLKDDPSPFTAKVRLILGNDILSRNQLAALAEDIESINVVSWRESDNVGRYGTLIELKSGDVGLWARYEANLFYRNPSL